MNNIQELIQIDQYTPDTIEDSDETDNLIILFESGDSLEGDK